MIVLYHIHVKTKAISILCTFCHIVTLREGDKNIDTFRRVLWQHTALYCHSAALIVQEIYDTENHTKKTVTLKIERTKFG